MNNITFILSSNSVKQLDAMAADLIRIGKQCGVVATGPVCFKGQRQLRFYGVQSTRFVDLLMRYKQPKKVSARVLT